MNMTLFGITFASWEHIWYTPLLVCALALIAWGVYKRMRAIRLLARPALRQEMLIGYSPFKQAVRVLCLMLASVMLFSAFLQPQWGSKEHVVHQEGRDVFIVLDVSRSMLAQDIKPDRLAFAKKKIKTLVKALKSDRVSLILFSGTAFVYCPLTADVAAFSLFLDQVDAESISSGTTAIDQAIEKVLQTLHTMQGKKNKIAVIFTDGEDFSRNLVRIKDEARKEGLTIFTVGVGTSEGAPVPLLDIHGKQTGHQKDEQGGIVISRLNEEVMHSLAHDLGGAYTKATQNDEDIKQLVARVEHFEKEAFDDKKISSQEERYYYFVAVACAALLLEWLL
jgi:Ca-activated chloride channel family protein